uniref:Uncharacterized protein n=1 Tax=Anguilla anguilla TaxID=7936 RepID=A0A0E9XSL4_ANGAN
MFSVTSFINRISTFLLATEQSRMCLCSVYLLLCHMLYIQAIVNIQSISVLWSCVMCAYTVCSF